MTDIDRDRILAVIGRLSWRFAKTMPDRPHEYVVRSADENEADYVALFQAVQAHGVRERTVSAKGRRYWQRYLYPDDGMKYWCMTTHLPSSHVINRAKIDP
jgi:hypothetical protein